MANIDNTQHSAYRHLGTHAFAIENFVDMTVLLPSQNDVIQCIKVSEGMLITRVSLMVVVAEGANTLGCDIGDGDGTNSYDDAVSLNGNAKTITRSLEATDSYGIGKYYSADDTIDITVLDASVDTGKYILIAEGFHIENPTVISTL